VTLTLTAVIAIVIGIGVLLFTFYCVWAMAAVTMSAVHRRRLPVLTEYDAERNCRPTCEKLTVEPVDSQLEYRKRLERNRRR
jgi:hypothetical protein